MRIITSIVDFFIGEKERKNCEGVSSEEIVKILKPQEEVRIVKPRNGVRKITYGLGKLWTQQGKTAKGVKCLAIREVVDPQPINSLPEEWSEVSDESEFSVIIEFLNIEGAKTLQIELNELIENWNNE